MVARSALDLTKLMQLARICACCLNLAPGLASISLSLSLAFFLSTSRTMPERFKPRRKLLKPLS